MAIQILSQANAFSQGADLWILPDSKFSSWTNEVDWYLNFQIAKFNSRELQYTEAPFKRLQGECDFSIKVPEFVNDTYLLLSSENRLPARYVLIFPFEVEITKWISGVLKKCDDLNVTNVRLFLPKAVSESAVQKNLNSIKKSINLAFVLNREVHI